jgi:hypothetical protein
MNYVPMNYATLVGVVTSTIMLLAAASCGGSRVDEQDAQPGLHDGGADGLSEAGDPSPCRGPCPDAGDRPPPLPRPECPPAEPIEGDACQRPGLACAYGMGSISPCRSYYACSEGTWKRDAMFQKTYPCQEVPPGYCPSVPPPWGINCTISDVGPPYPCVYEGLLCFCTSPFGGPGGAGNWFCYGPPANAQCPASLPNIGEGCDTPGVQCNYPAGICPGPPHTNVLCYDDSWEDGVPNRCPL